jgi:DNA-binding NarL/FixJ family response regulator
MTKPARAGQLWLPPEKKQLKQEVESGKSNKEIAKTHQRTSTAIEDEKEKQHLTKKQ